MIRTAPPPDAATSLTKVAVTMAAATIQTQKYAVKIAGRIAVLVTNACRPQVAVGRPVRNAVQMAATTPKRRSARDGYCTATATETGTTSTTSLGDSAKVDDQAILFSYETATATVPIMVIPISATAHEMIRSWQVALPIIAMLLRAV